MPLYGFTNVTVLVKESHMPSLNFQLALHKTVKQSLLALLGVIPLSIMKMGSSSL